MNTIFRNYWLHLSYTIFLHSEISISTTLSPQASSNLHQIWQTALLSILRPTVKRAFTLHSPLLGVMPYYGGKCPRILGHLSNTQVWLNVKEGLLQSWIKLRKAAELPFMFDCCDMMQGHYINLCIMRNNWSGPVKMSV